MQHPHLNSVLTASSFFVWLCGVRRGKLCAVACPTWARAPDQPVSPHSQSSPPGLALCSCCSICWFVNLSSHVAIHKSQLWFHGGVSRKEAQRLIEKQGLVDGWVQLLLLLLLLQLLPLWLLLSVCESLKKKAVSACCRMFLIRESQQHSQCFVLSLCHKLKTKHYLVIPVSAAPFAACQRLVQLRPCWLQK